MTMKNKNIIITGASSGIGKEVARELSRRQANLLLLARNIDALQDLKNELSNDTSKIEIMKCDVSNPEDIKQAVDYACELFGKIDRAILNAGIEENVSFHDLDSAKLEFVYRVNVFGISRFLGLLIPVIKGEGGFIAAVTSLADARSFPGSAAYCSTKIAASYLLESARAELSHTKIKIITIKPGFVRSPMTASHPYYMPFLMDADKAAKIIVNGIEKGKSRIYFPKRTAFLTYILSCMPDAVYDYLAGTIIPKYMKR